MGNFLRAAVLGLVLSGSAEARTIVLPHILETAGIAGKTAFAFDTSIQMVYSGETSATVDVYLFGDDGQPMRGSSGSELCNSCNYLLDANARKKTIAIDDLVAGAGGFGGARKTGFGVLVVGGVDPKNLKVQGTVSHSLENPKNVDVTMIPMRDLDFESLRSTRIIPWFAETSGSVSSKPQAFDTTFLMTYVGGLAGVAGNGGANVDLYTYDAQGAPLQGLNGDVCNPCTFGLSETNRKVSARLEDFIQERGGFKQPVGITSGFTMVVISGPDPINVTVGELVENSYQTPSNVEQAWIEAAAPGGESSTYVMPFFLDGGANTLESPRASEAPILLTYSSGLAGTPDGGGATVDLYLYDFDGNTPLKGADGVTICAPCTYELSKAARRQTIRVGDLVRPHGHTPSSSNVHAVVVAHGSDPRGVKVQALFMDSHDNAGDLSIHPIAPVQVSLPAFADAQRATFVVPHLFKTSGHVLGQNRDTDEALHFFYAGGLAGIPSGRLNLHVYLFDGPFPLRGNDGATCMPCSYSLNSATHYAKVDIGAIIGAGTKLNPLAQPYALIDARGDVKNLAGQHLVRDNRDLPLDASTFGSEIQMEPVRLVIPKINNTIFSNGEVVVFFNSEAGVTYRLEARSPDEEWDAIDEIMGNGESQFMRGEPSSSTQLFRLLAE